MRKSRILSLIIIILIISLVTLSIIYKKPAIIIIFFLALSALINLLPFLIYKSPLTKSNQEKFDTIIILGYPSTQDGRPSPIMKERVVSAVELFNKGYANYIICSGGCVHNKYTEADIMITLAKSLGIPDSCLVKENKSKNTYGNILNSLEILKKRNWSSAIVVTSPWHLRRSNYLLSKFNITYVMKKSHYPKEFSILLILAIYFFENYTMLKNKILFH